MSNLVPLKNGKSPTFVLREMDEAFPDKKAVIVIVLGPNKEVAVNWSELTLADLCFMSRVLDEHVSRNLLK